MTSNILQFPARLGPKRQKRYARSRKPCPLIKLDIQATREQAVTVKQM
jgi:hypothetical protein